MNSLKLVDSPPTGSSELAVIDISPPTIYFNGEGFDDRSASVVMRYAIEVHQSERAIRTNARHLCVSMYLCHQAYVAGSKNQSSMGWGPFCERNFASIGMSDGNIRAAVRTGESLVKHEQNFPEGIENFNRLSRAALFALGGNEETLVAVQEVLAKSPNETMTADAVRRIADELKDERIRLLQTQQRLAAAEETNVDLVQSVTERREQVKKWRERAEMAESAAKTPVESLVYQLPPGVKSEEDLRQSLQKENATLIQNQTRLKSEVNESTDKLSEIQRSLQSSSQISNVLASLEADVNLMRSKFPAALVEKMTTGTPAIKERLRTIAEELRAMALALDVK